MCLCWIIWYRDSAPESSLQCGTCKKSYCGNETHLDLTVGSGAKVYGEPMAASTELFRYCQNLKKIEKNTMYTVVALHGSSIYFEQVTIDIFSLRERLAAKFFCIGWFSGPRERGDVTV